MPGTVLHVVYNQLEGIWATWSVAGTKTKLLKSNKTQAAAIRWAFTAAKTVKGVTSVIIQDANGETTFTYVCPKQDKAKETPVKKKKRK